ncbi:Di-/tripeptide transporter [Pseudoalteromonas sp. THAF3]|uniref:MFS transporter n=1 Tax=Pseudoalteromonas ruthenica TaxID=151081 RepID=A0A5S3Z5V7_9GAMM|nr:MULTISPECIES: peptide MFS transporter [Pseudoalteromonas]MCF2863194.1 peptide MFS transporter [Pseudoalteromonas sp. CNAT2-18]MCG7559346.1 peptide MFS transporter [Pseudoalteromonas sp. CNAT2-18.1]MCG7566981.1 peptide MFS transporter [Pseudoalteromonas sp. CnMc7-15]MCG7571415.1 peptide MFS transporter [Pseudoalteromonas sp. CNC9-20]QFU04274.1 Di-/tripeptide transporter [Pseudoalteromonas sp. THAF3]
MSSAPKTGDLFGHPKGLFLLFFTEMWERMSYYGMRGIFVLYLSTIATAAAMGWDMAYFGIDPLSANAQDEYHKALQSNALSILGIYALLVYVTPVLGGWFADNVSGQRKAIIFGGLTMALGQFALGTPHAMVSGFEKEMMYLGLALLILGNGFFKPNISTMVGDLYSEGDKRRDGAFTIFYMGINLGSILGYFVVGSIGEKFDYQYGFLTAGVGMLLGVVLQLLLAKKYLGSIGTVPSAKQSEDDQGANKKPLTSEERDRVKVILIMSFFTIIFWAGFEQAAGSMNLFAKYKTDLVFFGWEMPASWLQAVNPIFIIILAPIFASLWIRMGDKEPDSPRKFALGMFFLGLGFISMVGAALQIGDDANMKAHVIWLVMAYIFHTMGELCLSPIGLSMVSKLAPLKFTSLLMGMWFLFSGLGNYVAAEIGKLVGEGGPLSTFGGVAIMAFIAGICLWLMADKLVDWMHGAEGQHDKEQLLEEELEITGEKQ